MLAKYQETVEQYRQQMYSFAYYSLRGKEDAEDVIQDVFIKLWQHWQKIDHDRLTAWLMRATRNAVIDCVRKRKSSRQHVTEQLQEQDIADHRSDEDQSLDTGFRRELEVAIKDLDEPFRSIVIMRDVQGLSYLEVGEVLELNLSQIKVYLHRARRRLRENTALRRLAKENEIIDDARPEPSDAVVRPFGRPAQEG